MMMTMMNKHLTSLQISFYCTRQQQQQKEKNKNSVPGDNKKFNSHQQFG